MAKKDKTAETPPAETPPAAPAPAPAAAPGRSGSRFLRIFLTVAGGLAAPALALAAFFLSGQSHDGTAKTANLGHVTAPAHSPSTVHGSAIPASTTTTTTSTSTTTTTAPITSAAGLRDPFAPIH